MSAWNDFNDAEQQQDFDLIPKGTLAKVRMSLKPGGFDDPTRGWTGGYATQSMETGAVFLHCEFVVLGGEFTRRKLWSNIGLYSPKGDAWANMGRSFIRAALNSARVIAPQDTTPTALAARRIASLAELDGLEFAARIDVEKDAKGEWRNVIKIAIEPDHAEYVAIMGSAPPHAGVSRASPAPAQSPTQPSADTPGWAQ